jgi:hypothetical protein
MKTQVWGAGVLGWTWYRQHQPPFPLVPEPVPDASLIRLVEA